MQRRKFIALTGAATLPLLAGCTNDEEGGEDGEDNGSATNESGGNESDMNESGMNESGNNESGMNESGMNESDEDL